MTASASPPNFNLILAGNRWVNPDGTPTPYFFRLFQNLFLASGAGQPPSVTDITNYTFSQDTSVEDYSGQISETAALQMTISDLSGQVATLERQVADLQELIMNVQNPPDTGINRQVDALTAIVMGTQ
jgi:hypothetical protein